MVSGEQAILLITGVTGSIGSALMRAFPDAEAYDPRIGVVTSCEHLIVCHGSEHGDLWEAHVASLIATLALVRVSGRVIIFCSRRGMIPSADELEYSAAKAGSFAVSQALYAAGRNITALCPGWVDSRMAREAGASPCIRVDDIIKTIRWLLSIPTVRVRELLMEAQL